MLLKLIVTNKANVSLALFVLYCKIELLADTFPLNTVNNNNS